MHWAQQYILSAAPRPDDTEPRAPPKPHQVLSAAWEMTMSEKVSSSTSVVLVYIVLFVVMLSCDTVMR
jgi:hypothetical protein